MNIYSIIATILSIVGQFGITHKKIWGLVLWIISDLAWIFVDAYIHPDYSQLSLYAFYALMNIYTIIVWKKK